jgi:transcription initiation factor TFIID subunit 10
MQFKDKRDRGYDPKDKRVVMTTDDLSAALEEHGVGLALFTSFCSQNTN